MEEELDEYLLEDESTAADLRGDTLIYVALSMIEVGFLQALLVQTYASAKDENVLRLCEDILEETVASEVELLDAVGYDLH